MNLTGAAPLSSAGTIVQVVGVVLTFCGVIFAPWVAGKFAARAARETSMVESRRVDDEWVRSMLAEHRDEITRLRDDRDEDRRELHAVTTELSTVKQHLLETRTALSAAVSYIQRLLVDRAEVMPGRPAPIPPRELQPHLPDTTLEDWRTPPPSGGVDGA